MVDSLIIRRLLSSVAQQAQAPHPSGYQEGANYGILGEPIAGTNTVYVTLMSNNQTIVAINNSVPNFTGRIVKLALINNDFYVVETVSAMPFTDQIPRVQDHDHSFYSLTGNATMIYGAQFIPLTAMTSESDPFTVRIYGAVVSTGSAWIVVPTTDVDLNSYIPTTGAKFVVIWFDTAGTVGVTEGTAVDVPELLTVSKIPSVTSGRRPLWAIKMYVGQEELRNDWQICDFVDLRNFGGSALSLSASGAKFQRNLTENLTMLDGESLIIKEYLNIGTYDLELQGDADLVIL